MWLGVDSSTFTLTMKVQNRGKLNVCFMCSKHKTIINQLIWRMCIDVYACTSKSHVRIVLGDLSELFVEIITIYCDITFHPPSLSGMSQCMSQHKNYNDNLINHTSCMHVSSTLKVLLSSLHGNLSTKVYTCPGFLDMLFDSCSKYDRPRTSWCTYLVVLVQQTRNVS